MKHLTEQQLMQEVRAEKGEAMHELALRLIDAERAIEATSWLKRGANLGHVESCYEMGNCYYAGYGVKEDWAQAFFYYEQAAQAGHPDAINNLADMYLNGEHVTVDEGRALELFKQAANLEVPEAMFTLGMMYEQGIGIETNSEQALQYYLKAARCGDVEAEYRMGSIYYEGLLGEAINLSLAYEWFEKAAEKHHVDALFNLGYINRNGIGRPADGKAALHYLKQAALQGDSSAAQLIAEMYEFGDLIEKDLVKAKKWRAKIIDV